MGPTIYGLNQHGPRCSGYTTHPPIDDDSLPPRRELQIARDQPTALHKRGIVFCAVPGQPHTFRQVVRCQRNLRPFARGHGRAIESERTEKSGRGRLGQKVLREEVRQEPGDRRAGRGVRIWGAWIVHERQANLRFVVLRCASVSLACTQLRRGRRTYNRQQRLLQERDPGFGVKVRYDVRRQRQLLHLRCSSPKPSATQILKRGGTATHTRIDKARRRRAEPSAPE
jgi:hypothetical protein